ncbi:MAG: DEAD/DEAH box helicase [Thermacetogeniaceae bacterium]
MGLFSLYAAWGKGFNLVFLSPEVAFDFAFIRQVYGCDGFSILTGPLPIGIASRVYRRLREEFFLHPNKAVGSLPVEKLRESSFRELASLRRYSQKSVPPLPDVSFCVEQMDLVASEGELEEIEALLTGRLLSAAEIGRMLRLGSESARGRLFRVLQALCLTGRAAILPGLALVKGDLARCQRCGWEGVPQFQECRGCGTRFCSTCPDCRIMGGMSLCTPLYTASAPATVEGESVYARKAAGWRHLLGLSIPKGRDAECWDIVCTPIAWGDRVVSKGASAAPNAPAEGLKRAGSWKGYRFDLKLTPAQERAAEALLRFAEDSPAGSSCLVWAACGAGKTEVSFPLIGYALGFGEKVLFATPRRDVVLEIAPRLEKAFGSKRVLALYGGCGNRAGDAPVVVATAHQALRFYRCFDLVVLDECDAYPYPESRMLHFAVRKAMHPEGKLVYLTATPARWMFEDKGKRLVDIIKIPARPHGFPLPEPRFLKVSPVKTTRYGIELHEEVLGVLAAILEKHGGKVFVFVPTVELTRAVGKALRSAAGKPPLAGLQPERIQWSHASDLQRDKKKDGFLRGEFAVFITTTIMERGVTVPGVHVIVLEADRSSVFDRAALVQMAGRCGRSPEYPTGEVWFVARSVTREMEEALMEIRSFNKEAFEEGYLLDDYEFRLREILKQGRERGVAPGADQRD